MFRVEGLQAQHNRAKGGKGARRGAAAKEPKRVLQRWRRRPLKCCDDQRLRRRIRHPRLRFLVARPMQQRRQQGNVNAAVPAFAVFVSGSSSRVASIWARVGAIALMPGRLDREVAPRAQAHDHLPAD